MICFWYFSARISISWFVKSTTWQELAQEESPAHFPITEVEGRERGLNQENSKEADIHLQAGKGKQVKTKMFLVDQQRSRAKQKRKWGQKLLKFLLRGTSSSAVWRAIMMMISVDVRRVPLTSVLAMTSHVFLMHQTSPLYHQHHYRKTKKKCILKRNSQ